MTILEKIKFEEDWLSEVNLTKENIKIALAGIRATALEQQQQPYEDCISRNEIIHTLNTMDRYVADELTLCNTDEKYPKNEVFIVDDVYELITESLPSVTPQQKVGKWMPHMVNDKDESIDHDVCSECHTCFYGERTGDWKYCPNCGSDNRDLESLGESFADGYEDGLEAKDE